jgi:hypothetical protein
MWYLAGVRRTTLVAGVAVALIDAALVVVLVTSLLAHPTPRPAPTPAPRSTPTSTSTTSPAPAAPPYHPRRVTPPPSAVERALNQSMAASAPAARALLATVACPAPATSASFRAAPASDAGSSALFALAFTQELLDLDFASSTRAALLAWASDNAAPTTLGDLPGALATRVLCASLTTGPSPVVSVAAWRDLARAGATWRASALAVSVNPTWIQASDAGWTSVDPLMVIDDVSGLLTVTTPGRAPLVESFAFALTLGGAARHPGYGVVALDDWTVN